MKEKTDRNLLIVKDKKDGMSWSKLIAKWGYSYATLFRILKRYNAI